MTDPVTITYVDSLRIDPKEALLGTPSWMRMGYFQGIAPSPVVMRTYKELLWMLRPWNTVSPTNPQNLW